MKKSNIKRKVALALLVVVGLLILLDQWTKADVAKAIPLGDSVVIIPHFFDLTYVRNTGIAFSLFTGARPLFLIGVPLITMGVVTYLFFKTDNILYEIGLALVLAGGIGNLIDRILLGYVRDFFSFYIFGYPFPIFNVADICVTCGEILVLGTYIYDAYKEL